jgi:transforming growth factor-beta-induced protein
MRHVNISFLLLALAALPFAVACGDDDDSSDNGGESGSDGSNAGKGGNSGSSGGAGSSAGKGGSSAGTGGSMMMAGSGAGSGGSSAGTGGSMTMAGSAGSASADAGPAEEMDIVETAIAAGSFEQLAAALTKADLVDALQGDGPFTVFAPSDDAFDAFEAQNPGVLAGLTVEQLRGVLTYHVVAGKVMATDLVDEGAAVTLGGSPVLFDLTGGAKVADAKVVTADIEATNGVIHVIDKIILPPSKDIVETAVEAGSFGMLAGALTSADLIDTLKGEGPFTVFAPTDAAFGKLAAVPTGDALENVLLYHVVDGAVASGNLAAGMVPTKSGDNKITVALGADVTIDDAKVTTANIVTKNGIIHVIDTVLVPE